MSLIPLITTVKTLEKALRKYNRAYYVQNQSLISDSEYDERKKKLIQYYEMLFKMIDEIPEASDLRADYKVTVQKMYDNGVISTVGFLTNKGFEKKSHVKRMYSLNNAFNEEELDEWLQRIATLLKKKEQDISLLYPICCETKVDGLSFSALYKNGKLTHILTRGDGENGEDVTRNVHLIANFPSFLESGCHYEEFEVRGEIFIKNSVFEEINSSLRKNGEKPFSTTRNAASGILRQLKNRFENDKILSYLVWGSATLQEDKMHYTEVRKYLTTIGFDVISEFKIANSINEIREFYHDISVAQNNKKISYDTDGIVCKINNLEIQDALGYTATAPRGAMAYKFSSDSYETKLLAIVPQVGKHGNLTPIAVVEPIIISGTTITRVTLHNFAEITKRDIRIGDIITVKKSGGVIPCICDVLYSERDEKAELPKFSSITECPFCGHSLVRETDATLICPNISCCERTIQRMIHFVSKDCMNIAGFGEKQIRQLYQAEIIKGFVDILKIATDNAKIESILRLDGWREESVQNLIYAIKKSYNVSLCNLILSLCIPHVGKESAKIIASQISSLKDLMRKISEGTLSMKGIGEKTAASIKNFFTAQENIALIHALDDILSIEQHSSLKEMVRDKTLHYANSISEKKAFPLKQHSPLRKRMKDELIREMVRNKALHYINSISEKKAFLLKQHSSLKKRMEDELKDIIVKIEHDRKQSSSPDEIMEDALIGSGLQEASRGTEKDLSACFPLATEVRELTAIST
ncbi:DNA ligase [Candidatus Fokinia solitaria]|uniref:DNA ligase n=1 Tax=Candidatus Fokinia solitaria TaxID=1802984 RepID=A0A2U8BRF0_9RICK|nr:NAD-dependent DNA ligase LigA [Candidatus Fokinia solitaria]AWD32924.1 DNA ligase [Candidatus Fokinia solitaria]